LSGGTPGAMNPDSMSLPFPYVTAMEKNDGTENFALKGGDATQPTLNTMWEGPLPGSKRPMKKEGAVILGAGGDCCYSNNNASEGTFYEGAIVSGYPSDETDEAVHANIVETGYGE
jgi:non-reducing end alpha-L-arabinofuranosidase